MPTREQIQDVLREVIDPELRKDIVTLGMVRSIEQPEEGRVDVVVFSLTTPGCPTGRTSKRPWPRRSRAWESAT